MVAVWWITGLLSCSRVICRALGWPALALPPYVQLVGRPGQDALVLAAGNLLAAAS